MTTTGIRARRIPSTNGYQAFRPPGGGGVTERRASRGGNGNERGNTRARKSRRSWLLDAYRANVDALVTRDAETGEVLAVATADPKVHGTPEAPGRLCLPGWEPVLERAGRVVTVEVAARCYRCGGLLVEGTITVDRIFPGKIGGKYGSPTQDRRDLRTNCRPACLGDNSSTGAALASKPQKAK